LRSILYNDEQHNCICYNCSPNPPSEIVSIFGGFMKVSQFIKLLQRLEYECGDITVINPDNYTPKAECKDINGIGKVIMIK
jgi:hypothetical protein